MEKQVKIMTPVLKYWGFEKHPFDDYILKDNTLDIFVDRETELHQLYNSLSNRLTGVYGFHGVGKSSVLRKFERTLKKDKIEVIYNHLTGTTPKAIFREFLAGLLHGIIEGNIRISSDTKLDAKQEFERVASSIKLSRGSEFSANIFIRGKVASETTHERPAHTEESACSSIKQIIENSMTPFVVIVDDLERLKLMMRDKDEYFQFVSSFGRTIDESFSHEGVAFVLSLDGYFVENIKNNGSTEEKSSFSFASLVHLKTFPPQILADLIKVRLNACGWERPLADFMTEDTFWILMLASSGHARRALGILRSAMEVVEMNHKPLTIDQESLKEGILKQEERLDDTDLAILQYLRKSGAASASDVKFQKAVGLTRIPLSNRLNTLISKINLCVKKEGVGGSGKDLFTVPEIVM